MGDPLIDRLFGSGPIGILCIGLLAALKIVWKRYDDLWQKYDGIQQARLVDRDAVTRAVVESSAAMREFVDTWKGH